MKMVSLFKFISVHQGLSQKSHHPIPQGKKQGETFGLHPSAFSQRNFKETTYYSKVQLCPQMGQHQIENDQSLSFQILWVCHAWQSFETVEKKSYFSFFLLEFQQPRPKSKRYCILPPLVIRY